MLLLHGQPSPSATVPILVSTALLNGDSNHESRQSSVFPFVQDHCPPKLCASVCLHYPTTPPPLVRALGLLLPFSLQATPVTELPSSSSLGDLLLSNLVCILLLNAPCPPPPHPHQAFPLSFIQLPPLLVSVPLLSYGGSFVSPDEFFLELLSSRAHCFSSVHLTVDIYTSYTFITSSSLSVLLCMGYPAKLWFWGQSSKRRSLLPRAQEDGGKV